MFMSQQRIKLTMRRTDFCKSSRSNVTREELKAMESLSMSLQADKGNCTVAFDESKHKDNFNTSLESGIS
jgi:hypothetical protein